MKQFSQADDKSNQLLVASANIMNSFFAIQSDPYYDSSELFPGANKKLAEMRKARVKAEAIKAEAAEQARREKII